MYGNTLRLPTHNVFPATSETGFLHLAHSEYILSMAAEVVAKILQIAIDEENEGYVVHFWVGQELADNPTLNEAFALLGSMDSLQREVYSFLVQWEDDEFTMEPDEDLAECLAIFDQYDDCNSLGPQLSRQWKTGQMAEAIVTHLVNANVFGVWRTTEDGEETSSPAASAHNGASDGGRAEGEEPDDDEEPPLERNV